LGSSFTATTQSEWLLTTGRKLPVRHQIIPVNLDPYENQSRIAKGQNPLPATHLQEWRPPPHCPAHAQQRLSETIPREAEKAPDRNKTAVARLEMAFIVRSSRIARGSILPLGPSMLQFFVCAVS